MQSLFPFKISATLFAFPENYKLCCILEHVQNFALLPGTYELVITF